MVERRSGGEGGEIMREYVSWVHGSIMDGGPERWGRLMERDGEGVGITAGEMIGNMSDEFYWGLINGGHDYEWVWWI